MCNNQIEESTMINNLKPFLFFIIIFTISFGNQSDIKMMEIADLAAINTLIDDYSQTEDDGTLLEQAKLMSDDRVWIGNNGAGRITNQSLNMNMQQTQVDVLFKSISGIKWFTDARDRLIKFYGDGNVAVASFYWYRTFVLPPNTSFENRDIMSKQPDPIAMSLVLEKKEGNWKIVHTHTSLLVKQNNK